MIHLTWVSTFLGSLLISSQRLPTLARISPNFNVRLHVLNSPHPLRPTFQEKIGYGGLARPFSHGTQDQESRHLREVRPPLRRLPQKDDQEDRDLSEEEVPVPVLRKDRSQEDRCWRLDVHEVPEVDHRRRVHPDHPGGSHREGCNQASPRGSGEVNSISLTIYQQKATLIWPFITRR